MELMHCMSTWIEYRFQATEVDFSNPDISMLCPWASHFICIASVDSALKWVPAGDKFVKGVQCYELFGGIALKKHAILCVADVLYMSVNYHFISKIESEFFCSSREWYDIVFKWKMIAVYILSAFIWMYVKTFHFFITQQ